MESACEERKSLWILFEGVFAHIQFESAQTNSHRRKSTHMQCLRANIQIEEQCEVSANEFSCGFSTKKVHDQFHIFRLCRHLKERHLKERPNEVNDDNYFCDICNGEFKKKSELKFVFWRELKMRGHESFFKWNLNHFFHANSQEAYENAPRKAREDEPWIISA